jgi:hypothetical protein
MKKHRIKATLIGLTCGAIPLITTVSCDPYRGTFDVFRDQGGPSDYYVFDGFWGYDTYYGYDQYYGYDDYYVDDCWGWCW